MISRFAHLAFWRPALRVLCYHHVHPSGPDRFTVTPQQLQSQLRYLQRSGFTFVHARDLLGPRPLAAKPLLITFDDGYIDNLEHAQPVLAQHQAKATLFMVTGHAGEHPSWADSTSRLMTASELRRLNPEVFELALHSHHHRSFATLGMAEVAEDLQQSFEFFRQHDVPFTPALAYPFGARPKARMRELSAALTGIGVPLAFRIGNRINPLPLPSPHEIQRIDVRGDESDLAFRRKLWLGRL